MLCKYVAANISGRTVLRCRLELLDFCNGRLESRRGRGYSSVVYVVCCVGSGLCDELIIGIE
jgi:hypothetical protein